MPNAKSYEERIEIHRFSAVVWASLARDARDMLASEGWDMTRQKLEAFIERALKRSLRHYREADAIRRRGYSEN